MFVSQETSIAQIVDLVEIMKLGTVCPPQESPQKERRRNSRDSTSVMNDPAKGSAKQEQVAEN